MRHKHSSKINGISRRHFLGGAAVLGLSGVRPLIAAAQQAGQDAGALLLTNGRIYTMNATNTVASQVLIRNGRFAAVGNNLAAQAGNARTVDLRGRTMIPGLIDAHNHIVLVGNRPGWHTPLEHVFTIPDAIAALKARTADVPQGEFITTIGPIAAMQFDERRLPNLMELDAVDRPVFIQAAQGGSRSGRWQTLTDVTVLVIFARFFHSSDTSCP